MSSGGPGGGYPGPRAPQRKAACAPGASFSAMQTLQSLTQSLNDHQGLQKLKVTLQELPAKFTTQTASPEDYLLGNVSGEYNYNFTFRLEGGGFFQTGVLVASASSPGDSLPIPLRCRWRRRIGDMPVELPGVTSNMYQISADDVGTDITVEVEPADCEDGLMGIARGEIGPFELDPSTRRSLENALGNGSARFTAAQSRGPGDGPAPGGGPGSGAGQQRQQLVIEVSLDGIRVVPVVNGSEHSARAVDANYSSDFPKIIIHPLDTTKFQLVVNDRTFHLHAMSRTSRDLIALTIRCFHARRYITTAQVLAELLPVSPMTPQGHSPAGPAQQAAAAATDGRLDACVTLERLTKELNRAMAQRETSEKALRNTHHEKRQLQEQLMETITGFTEMIEGLQHQCAEGAGATHSGVSIERIQDQLRESMSQIQTLEGDLRIVRQQLEEARNARQAVEGSSGGAADYRGGGSVAATAQEVDQLREEHSLLQARHDELRSRAGVKTQTQNTDNKVHASEMKRLRQDVEALHNQKEALRRRLQDEDREREELQENFLYVKGQLDKVQMKQAHAAATGSTDGSKEMHKLRASIAAVNEERSRMAMRQESVCRDLEKGKAYHQQSIERIMAANARLMEEKDRAEREVRRVSQLYAESVQQMQRGSEGDGDLSEPLASASVQTGGSAAESSAEVAQLRAQLLAADEQLKKKDQENESLKNRIRKLAVA